MEGLTIDMASLDGDDDEARIITLVDTSQIEGGSSANTPLVHVLTTQVQ